MPDRFDLRAPADGFHRSPDHAGGYMRKLPQRRWRCVTGAANRRRRDRRLCPCPLRAGELCTVRGKTPLLICSGAASRRGLPHGGSTRFHGGSTRQHGHPGRIARLRLRYGNCRAAAGGFHHASLMIKRSEAAAAAQPGSAAPFRLTDLAISAGHTPGPVRRPGAAAFFSSADCGPAGLCRVSLGW